MYFFYLSCINSYIRIFFVFLLIGNQFEVKCEVNFQGTPHMYLEHSTCRLHSMDSMYNCTCRSKPAPEATRSKHRCGWLSVVVLGVEVGFVGWSGDGV